MLRRVLVRDGQSGTIVEHALRVWKVGTFAKLGSCYVRSNFFFLDFELSAMYVAVTYTDLHI